MSEPYSFTLGPSFDNGKKTSLAKVFDELADLKAQLAARDRELAQLKADHAEMVRRNAVLRTRHDLPVERVKALDSFIAERDAARRELGEACELIGDLTDESVMTVPAGNTLTHRKAARFLARHAPTNKETE